MHKGRGDRDMDGDDAREWGRDYSSYRRAGARDMRTGDRDRDRDRDAERKREANDRGASKRERSARGQELDSSAGAEEPRSGDIVKGHIVGVNPCGIFVKLEGYTIHSGLVSPHHVRCPRLANRYSLLLDWHYLDR